MDIIKRNLFRMIGAGAFGEKDEPAEPMSAFKWKKLYHVCEAQGLSYMLTDNVATHERYIHTNIPEAKDSGEDAENRYRPSNFKTLIDEISLNTAFTNRRLDRIIDTELHAIDTSTETLTLLAIIIDTLNDMLRHGIIIKQLVILGRFLRKRGDKVDFEKLDLWLGKLMLRRVAQLQGNMLMSLFGFEQDELPFVRHDEPAAYRMAMHSLSDPLKDPKGEWHFRQSSTGFVRNNNSAFLRNFRRSMKYMSYTPIEAVGNIASNFMKSLSEIEE